ncbi:hypothetical protein [Streptomyces sp. NPDC014685]|uniref:hypothetical protein n=1 Tax=Streptomyces sp. NPDC014685 TaxID=3364881 RepID=UPI0036F6A908
MVPHIRLPFEAPGPRARFELPTGSRPLLGSINGPRPNSSFDPTRTGFAERGPACLDVLL